jgi:PEP-CTERM motif
MNVTSYSKILICAIIFWPSASSASTRINLGNLTTTTRIAAVENGSDVNSQVLNKSRDIDFLFDTLTSPTGAGVARGIGGSSAPSQETDALFGLRTPIGSRVPPYASAYTSSARPVREPISQRVSDSRTLSETTVLYSFQITGPENVNVPIDVSLFLEAVTDGATQLVPFLGSYQTSGAEIHIFDPRSSPDIFTKRVECSGAACDNSFSGTERLNLLSNVRYGVRLGAFARTNSFVVSQQGFAIQANSASTAGSFADPFFSIDTELFDARQYSIIFSNGVNNVLPFTGGVPEPNTWAMLVLGFGMVGAAIRRSPKLAYHAA